MWVEIKYQWRCSLGALVTPSRVCELKYFHFFIGFSIIRHTLTGVWVEISAFCGFCRLFFVTPSRVCELKWRWAAGTGGVHRSHPHGCVSWNLLVSCCFLFLAVTPSRVCELKSSQQCTHTFRPVTPSRVCELKYQIQTGQTCSA